MSQDKTKEVDSSKTLEMPSKRHVDFIERYLMHFNATKAYSDTYGVKNMDAARASASKLLASPNVQQYLQRRLAERKAELHVDTNYVVRKLTEIVEADFVDSTQYLTADQLKKIPTEIRKLIQTIEIMKTKNSSHTNSGDYETETEKYKVTFMSKDAAINALGKHTGAFIKDNVSANINLDQMTFTDALKQLDI
jgi:phage terminase small subunit